MKENATRMFSELNNQALAFNVPNQTWLPNDGSVSVSYDFEYDTVVLNSFTVEQWEVDSVVHALKKLSELREAEQKEREAKVARKVFAKETWSKMSDEQKLALKEMFDL